MKTDLNVSSGSLVTSPSPSSSSSSLLFLDVFSGLNFLPDSLLLSVSLSSHLFLLIPPPQTFPCFHHVSLSLSLSADSACLLLSDWTVQGSRVCLQQPLLPDWAPASLRSDWLMSGFLSAAPDLLTGCQDLLWSSSRLPEAAINR